MKKNLLLCLFILGCGIAQGQYNDRIITHRGDTIKCSITRIEDNSIYYHKEEYSTIISLHLGNVNKIIVDNKNISRDDLIQRYENYREQTTDSIPGLANNYFTHNFKINPGSFINEYTLKYECRFNNRLGMQFEIGYLHSINGMESWHSPVEHHFSPFAWRGFVARGGIRYYLLKHPKNYQNSICVNLIFKNEEHGKIALLDVGNGNEFSEKRTVYGINFIYSKEKYIGSFLFEFYAGISLRVLHRATTIYSTNTSFGLITYNPPKYYSYYTALPAIQGGINIGFGFNGAKKKK